MAVTVTLFTSRFFAGNAGSNPYGLRGYKIELGANNDAVDVDLRYVDWSDNPKGAGVVWVRSDEDDVEVTWTVVDDALESTPSTTDWHAHSSTGIAVYETTPIAGLRFKRTGTDGDTVHIRGVGIGEPRSVTGV